MSDLTQEMTLNVISIFDNYQIELAEKGHLILSTEVTETALNYYGMLMVVIFSPYVIK